MLEERTKMYTRAFWNAVHFYQSRNDLVEDHCLICESHAMREYSSFCEFDMVAMDFPVEVI